MGRLECLVGPWFEAAATECGSQGPQPCRVCDFTDERSGVKRSMLKRFDFVFVMTCLTWE